MSTPARIEAFQGEYRFLSNFWIEPDGTSVEVEYQRAKCKYQEDRPYFDNITPVAAKRMGTSLRAAGRQREDWEEVNIEIMWFYVAKKVIDHPSVYQMLYLTGDAILVEGNHWHDTFWGVCNGLCFSARSPRHKPSGANGLGEIWMDVRSHHVPNALQNRYYTQYNLDHRRQMQDAGVEPF